MPLRPPLSPLPRSLPPPRRNRPRPSQSPRCGSSWLRSRRRCACWPRMTRAPPRLPRCPSFRSLR
ncbi:MAG: hypothetical protein C0515_08245 [Novosphingobium sp.]|nr:hypothetical protein [Novosphingobium sp.]